jgi:hypothetical protein
MTESIFFNAHHSPIGAFASFTLGYRGAKGGLGLEIGKPANQNVFIGLQSADGSGYEALPFFADAVDVIDESARYVSVYFPENIRLAQKMIKRTQLTSLG